MLLTVNYASVLFPRATEKNCKGAESQGKSVNQFILDCIEKEMREEAK